MTVTIRDVAREAGVSISTVSRALSSPEQVAEETRNRVQATATRMGYRPNHNAQSLITGRRGSIGLVVPDLENPFFGSICKGVQARARAAGYAVFVADTDEDPAVEAEIVRSLIKQVDGVILCSARGTDAEIDELARETPLVLANRYLDGIRSITFDNRGGVRTVMSHLVALGHRRIAYAAGPLRSWSNQERSSAFAEFAASDDTLDLIELGNFPPYFSGGVHAGDLAIASGATAVVAYNDIMALGLIDRLRQRGLSAPDDMSVTGFDNVAVSTFVWPNLTTVDLPRVQMGRISVDTLLELVEGSTTATPTASAIELPVSLVVRQSSGVVGAGVVGAGVQLSPGVPVVPRRLSIATLPDRLPDGSTGPRIDPTTTTIGIVHFGIGAFHRSHQAVFTEDAAAATGETGWGILGVTGRTDAVAQQLRPQDCLYGVLQKDQNETSLRIVGSVREVAFPGRDSVRVVEVLACQTTQIASMTITEKGYLRAPDGAINLSLASVQHDLRIVERQLAGEQPTEPSETAIGLLVRGLAARFRLNAEPFTVLCCDNLVDNGAMVKRVIVSLAAAIGSGNQSSGGFLAWLEESVAFPSSMVDRITPAVTEADREEALALLGLRDDALVVAEPFSQWVIEDRFAGRRPAWELAGVTITDDVAPYEKAKLRILNATHSLLAYLGMLKGHRTIADAVADDALLLVAGRVLDDDILPTLEELPGLDLRQYRDAVLERIGNPALKHTTSQVGMDGSQKLPNRIIGVAVERLAAGELPNGLALAIAAWIRYIASTMTEGAAPLNDPIADILTAAIGSADAPDTDPSGVVDRMFAIDAVFPAELTASAEFRDAVAAQLDEVRRLTAIPL